MDCLGLSEDEFMQFAGVLPEDAPDPRLEREERLKDTPIPIVVLAPQPSVELMNSVCPPPVAVAASMR